MRSVLIIAAVAVLGFAFTKGDVVKGSVAGSTIKWVGKKVTGEHFGNVQFAKMDIQLDDAGTLTKADFDVDMSTIEVKDLEGDNKMKLEGHLKSADFFDIENHPTATFKTTDIKSLGKGSYEVSGDLTIKDITNSITFPAQVSKNDGKINATASVVVDRSKFNVKYNSGSFFDGLGDKLIYDEFELEVTVVKG